MTALYILYTNISAIWKTAAYGFNLDLIEILINMKIYN